MTNTKRLRNVGISAHIDSGKTTLAERMLFYCGRIHAIREVRGADGGATMDSDPIERKRGITINSAATRLKWQDHTINMIDTPGHVDFTVEVERSLRVLDGAIFVLCSVSGVQSQSLTVDRQMRRYGVPRIAFINKMDRIGANPNRVLDHLRERLDCNAVALQIPIGCEDQFVGVVDLIGMRAVYFEGEYGQDVRFASIPDWLHEEARQARENMLESLAMLDEDLLETIGAGNEPDASQLRQVIRDATIQRQLTPVLMGSAFKNKGVQELLAAIALYLPSPNERHVVAIDTSRQSECADSARKVVLTNRGNQPTVAMAFKTVVEKFGQLTYLRLYQGSVRRGQSYRNARTGKRVRFGRLVRMHASDREEIESADAGDIVAVVGVECASGDTFVSDGCELAMEDILVAEPVMQLAITPKCREDADKLSKALERFRREDPTLRVMSDPETGETLIAGMGQLHLDVYVQRLREQHACDCIVGRPRVTYLERPTESVEFEHRLKKMTGGPGMYASIVGRLDVLTGPNRLSSSGDDVAFEFEDRLTGGRIQPRFVNAVRQGFVEALREGPVGRYQVVGVKMTLTDGDEHKQDSSERAFLLCARDAMRNVILPRAGVVLLEPVMRLSVDMPSEYLGAVAGHLSRKRATVTSTDHTGGGCRLVAEAPLAELFEYSSELRSMTQGNGTFSMQPLTYRPAPQDVQESVRAARSNELPSRANG